MNVAWKRSLNDLDARLVLDRGLDTPNRHLDRGLDTLDRHPSPGVIIETSKSGGTLIDSWHGCLIWWKHGAVSLDLSFWVSMQRVSRSGASCK